VRAHPAHFAAGAAAEGRAAERDHEAVFQRRDFAAVTKEPGRPQADQIALLANHARLGIEDRPAQSATAFIRQQGERHQLSLHPERIGDEVLMLAKRLRPERLAAGAFDARQPRGGALQ
jgi:hypothetical protein